MMKKIVPMMAVVALAASAAWAGPTYDFKKTKAFIAEMETRPDFPVAAVLANDYVYTFKTLGQKIEPARQKKISAWFKNAQQRSGGFTGDKANQGASILFTDVAVDTLSQIDSLSAIDLPKMKGFILSLKNADGGFGFSATSRDSSLATTYYAVKLLSGLKALPEIDKAKTAEYIKGFKKPEGGFGFVKGKGAPSARMTYMAVYALNDLGMLDEATKKSAVSFLETSPCGKRGMKATPDLNELDYAVRTAGLLKAREALDQKKVSAFMDSIYIKVNGGFGPLEGYGSTPDSTTTALRILAATGKIKQQPAKIAKNLKK